MGGCAEEYGCAYGNNGNCQEQESESCWGLGLPEWVAYEGAYSRKGYWRMAGSGVVHRSLTKERLIRWGFYDLALAYQSMHVNY